MKEGKMIWDDEEVGIAVVTSQVWKGSKMRGNVISGRKCCV